MLEQKFALTYFENYRASRNPIPIKKTFPEFVDFLGERRIARGKSSGPCIAPATFNERRRLKRNVDQVSMLFLDFDNKQATLGQPAVTMQEVHSLLAERNLTHIIATTWSHSEQLHRFRVILPLADPIQGEAFSRWVKIVLAKLEFDERLMLALDNSCFSDPSRAWLLPCHREGNAPVIEVHKGELLLSVPVPTVTRKPKKTSSSKPNLRAPGRGDFATLDVVAWLGHHGLYLRPTPDAGKHYVRCPWENEHTSEGNGTDCVIWEPDGRSNWPSFHCSHEHCAHRNITTLIEHIGGADEFCSQEYRPHDPAAEKVAAELLNDSASKREYKSLLSDGNVRPYIPNPDEEDLFGYPKTPEEALRRFVQVVGLGAAYDRKHGRFLRMQELLAVLSGRIWVEENGKFKQWKLLNAANRPTADKSEVVFRPGQKLRPPMINTFTGLKIDGAGTLRNPEKHESVRMLLDLLQTMSGDDETSFRFILNWLAWPLKHLGAKLRSCLVVKGAQGVGKSLVFSHVMRSIYGEDGTPGRVWAGVIGQSELVSSFNAWMSQRLYLVAAEVTTAFNVKETANRLKALITEPHITVNAKHLPVRLEKNCANLVFISNEALPVWLDGDDRRHFVLDIPATAKREPSFYAKLVKEFEKAPQAWYQFLRNVWQVDESFPNLPVPMTSAKEALLDACKSSMELFVEDWFAEELVFGEDQVLPVLCFRSSALNRVYRHWCRERGYKPVSERNLQAELRKLGFLTATTGKFRYWIPLGRDRQADEASRFERLSRCYCA